MQAAEQMLVEVAREVLETMAFAFVLTEMDDSCDQQRTAHATVCFQGPWSGWLSLTMPTATVRELAGNMFAVEDSQSCGPEQQHDALGELANVMCGNLLSALAGPEAVFDVDTPQIVADIPATTNLKTFKARVPLENGWAELLIAFTSDASPC